MAISRTTPLFKAISKVILPLNLEMAYKALKYKLGISDIYDVIIAKKTKIIVDRVTSHVHSGEQDAKLDILSYRDDTLSR